MGIGTKTDATDETPDALAKLLLGIERLLSGGTARRTAR
jgi:hypothetical protein